MPLPQYLSPTLMFSRASLENAFQLSEGDPLPRLGKGFRLDQTKFAKSSRTTTAHAQNTRLLLTIAHAVG